MGFYGNDFLISRLCCWTYVYFEEYFSLKIQLKLQILVLKVKTN